MNQDTRKDPRAKVLTMTVRYKSATLDEFIEHHSYDVSRGGMFIKTPSPFPPGTLLKFEVKIADEQRLMQGVGRVVWKRESNDSNDTRPSGMGVKFIKIDDESRRTIDRLIDVRGDGANAFDQGSAPRLPVASAPATSIASSHAPAKPAEPVARSRKATVIGLGAMKPGSAGRAVNISSGPPRTTAPAPEKVPSEPFFPKSDYKAEMPAVEDQTMMKQAKELLQDALRHAGGTPEDVNAAAKVSSIPPHVPRPDAHRSVPPRPSKRGEAEPMKAVTRSPFADHEDPEAATTIWRANEAAALLAESMKDSMPPEGEEIHGRITARPPGEEGSSFRDSEPATEPGASPESDSAKPVAKPALEVKDEATAAEDDAAEEKLSVKSQPAAKAEPVPAKSKQPKAPIAASPASVAPGSERASSRSRASQAMMEAARETEEGGGGGKGLFALVALAAFAGITFYLTRPPPGGPPPPEPAAAEPAKAEVAPETPPPAASPIVSTPEPTTALSAAPAESAPAASAAPVPSAAPAAPVASEKPVAAKPVRRVVPRRVPKKKVEAPPTGDAPVAPAEPAPIPPAGAAPEPTPPAPPAAPPATPPAPTAPPLGDNPY